MDKTPIELRLHQLEQDNLELRNWVAKLAKRLHVLEHPKQESVPLGPGWLRKGRNGIRT